MERTSFNNQKYMESLAMEAFNADGFLVVNKTLIKGIGLIPALLLSNYIDRYSLHKKKNQDSDGWFYFTHQMIIEQLNISEKTIRKNKIFLQELNIIQTKMAGLPAKEFIKINFVTLIGSLGLVPSKWEGLALPDREGLYIETIKKENIKRKKINFINLFPFEFSNNKVFTDVLEEYEKHRTSIKKPLSDIAKEKVRNKLIKYNVDISIQALNIAIENNWTGVFPESIKQITSNTRKGNFQKAPDEDFSYLFAPLPDEIIKLQRRKHD